MRLSVALLATLASTSLALPASSCFGMSSNNKDLESAPFPILHARSAQGHHGTCDVNLQRCHYKAWKHLSNGCYDIGKTFASCEGHNQCPYDGAPCHTNYGIGYCNGSDHHGWVQAEAAAIDAKAIVPVDAIEQKGMEAVANGKDSEEKANED